MNNTEKKNGIIYCRVSSTEQVEGTSLESQQKICSDYAVRENIQVLQVFIEKGESAKTADRTEFIKAVSFCGDKKNKVDYFIVYKLDRFARNQADHITVRETLRKYHVELKSVTEPISDSPVGKMMEGILSAFAEFDNNVRTERSVNGMKERIKQGIWVWGAPIGYHRLQKGANLSPHPTYAPYIKMIFEEYSKGTYTYDSLAKYITARGFTTTSGKPAFPQLIERIIKNPIYCGIIRIWDMETEGKFEPIISKDLFYLCQGSGRRHKSTSRSVKNPEFPLRKLTACQFCGESLTGSNATGRKGVKYPYYHHQKQSCAYAKFIPKESFEQLFVEHLHEISPSLKYENAFKTIVLDIWKNNYKKFDEDNRSINREIDALMEQRQRVFDLHREKTYSNEEFIDQKELINKKIAGKRSLTHDKSVAEFNMDEALEYCFSFIRNSAETWLKMADRPEKRLRFQNLIFETNLPFSGEKFGTTKLTPIYSIYQQYLSNPSQLVPSAGIEPTSTP